MFNVRPRRAAAALVAITLLAYLPIFRAGFIWDDDSYVEHNASLRTLDGLWRIWTDTHATPQYYPLVHTTFWIEAHLWGTSSAIPFHIVNVLLHATAAVLLWRLLQRLLPGWPLQRPPMAAEAATPVVQTAWLAAALWAVHPVQVESVAWVTERKNVLSAVFYLLAFTTYLSATASDRIERRRYAGAFCLFLLALLSKTVTATLPAAILLVTYWKRGRLTRKDILPTIPFFLAGILLGLNTGHLEKVQVGARGPEFLFSPADRLLIAGRAVWFYAAKLVSPWPLSFIYPRWSIDPRQLWQWAFPTAAIAVVVALWIARRRLGRGPLVAVLFFAGTLFPALGFANVYPMRYSFVADHFQYLASIGPIVLLASALPLAASQTGDPGKPTSAPRTCSLQLLCAALLVACIAVTFARTTIYHDRVTLWTDTIAKNPDAWMPHTNLGLELYQAGKADAAYAEFQRAAELAPQLRETHVNLALVHALKGNFSAAADEYRASVTIDPTFADGYASLAKVLISLNRLPEAIAAARRATDVAPTYANGHYALGRAFEQAGNLPEAIAAYGAAARFDPKNTTVQIRLADVLNRLGRLPEAEEHYRSVVALDPINAAAWSSLGHVQLGLDHRSDAAASFRRALTLNPKLAPATQGLRQVEAH